MGKSKDTGTWGSDYDGYQPPKPTRRKLPLTDRHGREMSKTASTDQPMRRFKDAIDVEKLELFLGEHDKYADFIVALHDPDHMRLSFAALCRKFNVTLHELQMLYTDGMRHMGLLNMANKLPQVMEDVAEDALAHQVLCNRCDGKRVITEVTKRDDKGKVVETVDRDCPVCNGDGKVREVGDKHARDLVFESMKLTNQKVPLIAQQFNMGDGGVSGNGLDARVEGMLKLTQGITMNTRPTNASSNEVVNEVVNEHQSDPA